MTRLLDGWHSNADWTSEPPYCVMDVARAFRVSVHTIYRDIRSGKLRALRFGRGRGALRIPSDALQAYRERLVGDAVDHPKEKDDVA